MKDSVWASLETAEGGLRLHSTSHGWRATWQGKTLSLPLQPESPLGREFLAWAKGQAAAERSPWFWDGGRILSRAADSFSVLLRQEAEAMGEEALEPLFILFCLAAALHAKGQGSALEVRLPGRTLLQSWAAAFYALAGPRRVKLDRWGLPGRGLGGSLFTSEYLEVTWRRKGGLLPFSDEFLEALQESLSGWGWIQEQDEEEGVSLAVLALVGEDLGLGHESYPSEPLPPLGEGGFGGAFLPLARVGSPTFTALCRTPSEWTACRARVWAAWPHESRSLPLDRLVVLADRAKKWPHPEGELYELKAGWEWDPKLRRINGDLRLSVLRSVAGMLNAQGGVIALGVRDDGEAPGLNAEISRFRSRQPMDVLEQKIREGMRKHLRPLPLGLVKFEAVDWSGRVVALLTVAPAGEPVEMAEKDPSHGGVRVSLYVRDGNRTLRLTPEERAEWEGGRGRSSSPAP